jgi:hypothetical protein
MENPEICVDDGDRKMWLWPGGKDPMSKVKGQKSGHQQLARQTPAQKELI